MTISKLGVIWNPSKVDGDSLREAVAATFVSDGVETPVDWWETSIEDTGHGMAHEAATW